MWTGPYDFGISNYWNSRNEYTNSKNVRGSQQFIYLTEETDLAGVQEASRAADLCMNHQHAHTLSDLNTPVVQRKEKFDGAYHYRYCAVLLPKEANRSNDTKFALAAARGRRHLSSCR
jgi:hypothetical protein